MGKEERYISILSFITPFMSLSTTAGLMYSHSQLFNCSSTTESRPLEVGAHTDPDLPMSSSEFPDLVMNFFPLKCKAVKCMKSK